MRDTGGCKAAAHRFRSILQAGATAVVPETLEPSLQLAAAVLSQLNLPSDEVAQAIQSFRKNHVAELQASKPFSRQCCATSAVTL